jgi:hypothetical protein
MARIAKVPPPCHPHACPVILRLAEESWGGVIVTVLRKPCLVSEIPRYLLRATAKAGGRNDILGGMSVILARPL